MITGRPVKHLSDRSYLYINQGGGNYTKITNPITSIAYGSLKFLKINTDDYLDLVVTGLGFGVSMKQYINNGSNDFLEVEDASFMGVWHSDISIGDVDNDGDTDILTVGRDDGMGHTNLYYNTHSILPPSCDQRSKISGIIFNDKNGNGMKDASEKVIPGYKIALSNGRFGITNKQGMYTILTADTGSFTLSPSITKIFSCNGNYYDVGNITTPIGGLINIELDTFNLSLMDNNFGINTNSTSPCGQICGHVFLDLNEDGVKNNGEVGREGVGIKFSPGGLVPTDVNGDYCVQLPMGEEITIELVRGIQHANCGERPVWLQSYPNDQNYSVTLNGATSSSTADFGVHHFEGENHDVSMVSIRPGFNGPGKDFRTFMDFKSYGNIDEICTLRLDYPDVVELKGKSRIAKTEGDNFVIWEFLPGTTPTSECMSMLFHLDDVISVDDNPLVWEANYYCGDTLLKPDDCPLNNKIKREFTLTTNNNFKIAQEESSFTFMESYAGNSLEQEISPDDTSFSYIINFRNETNDTIYHVYIIDTLPSNMRLESVSKPFSNLPHSFYINDDNVMIWEFDNIVLPPMSVDTLNSYYFVQYNTILKQNELLGSIVTNEAQIIYNGENIIYTDQVQNSISLITSYKERGEIYGEELNLYPNPSNGIYYIKLKNSSQLKSPKVYVRNIHGELVDSFSTQESSESITLNLSQLIKGVYFITLLSNDKVIGTGKLVKN